MVSRAVDRIHIDEKKKSMFMAFIVILADGVCFFLQMMVMEMFRSMISQFVVWTLTTNDRFSNLINIVRVEINHVHISFYLNNLYITMN